MAKKIRVELNIQGVGELLKSQDLADKLRTLAEGIAGGWEVDTKQAGTRVIASIYSTDPEQIAEERDTHALVGRL